MMNTNKKTPKLRFKGFTDAWEQRKLGDIATFSKGNGYSKSDLTPSGSPIILYGRLYTNYETTIKNVDTFVKLKDKSVISQGGEVIVPASGETAEDISRASVVKNQGIILGGDLNVIKVNRLLDPTFLALTISNGEQQKELSKRAQGKSVVHLHNSDLQEVKLTFPLLNEQRAISTLFEKMDNTITLHQRKLEKLKLNKSALLQKLFPQNGCTIPEVRFKGFTDAWEQRKLGEIADITKLAGFEFTKYIVYSDKGNIIALRGLNIKDGDLNLEDVKYIDSSDFTKLKRSKLFRNDILFTYVGTIGEVARIQEDDKYYLAPNVSRIRIKNRLLSEFLMYYMDRDLFYQKIIFPLIATSSQPALSMANIREFNITYPRDINEQQKIALVFSLISHLITLHQHKLNRLISIKKALLQQLFV